MPLQARIGMWSETGFAGASAILVKLYGWALRNGAKTQPLP